MRKAIGWVLCKLGLHHMDVHKTESDGVRYYRYWYCIRCGHENVDGTRY